MTVKISKTHGNYDNNNLAPMAFIDAVTFIRFLWCVSNQQVLDDQKFIKAELKDLKCVRE